MHKGAVASTVCVLLGGMLLIVLVAAVGGQIAYAQGQPATVTGTVSDQSSAALLLADCDLRMGENRKVIELLGPREAAHPDDRAMIYVLGTALIRDNQTERGQKLIDRILRNGESAEAHVMLGTASMMGQDYKNAAK